MSTATIVEQLRAAGCVFAEDEAELLVAGAADAAELSELVRRRVGGQPLEQVLGWVAFCGRRFAVDPGVFVPRRRTEYLVERAASLAPARAAIVVDLCCGCGAIGAAVAGTARVHRLYAVDIDPAAVRNARRNLAPLGGRVLLGDLYEPLPAGLRGRIDVLTANVPYVPTAEVRTLPVEARGHEPRAALDGGADGLDVLRRLAGPAPEWLAPGGCLLVETGAGQAAEAAGILRRAGLEPTVAHCPDRDATVVTGVRR